MTGLRLLRSILAVLVVAASWPSGLAVADVHRTGTETQLRLDDLFSKLKGARTEEAARRVEARIWQTWSQTDNGDVAQVMTRVQFAMRAGMFDLALGELDKVVELDPDYAEGWNRRATVLFLLKRDQESVRDIQRVLELEPRHFGALSGLGLIHMRARNWSSALKSFRKALEINPYLKERGLISELEKKVKGQPL
jgi:tetratricopeptide (TPR) repeat protein